MWRSCAEEAWRPCLLCTRLSGTCRASGSWRVPNSSLLSEQEGVLRLYVCPVRRHVGLGGRKCPFVCSNRSLQRVLYFPHQALLRCDSEGGLQRVATALRAARRQRLRSGGAHPGPPHRGPPDPASQGGRPRPHPVRQLCAQ